MKLSQKQFDGLLRKNKLVLSLIGMSNIGKTYWSKKLAKLNFQHFNCDSFIEAKLAPFLRVHGYCGIEGVSRWMGQPYDKRFPKNQQKYLNFEKEAIENILTKLKNIKKYNVAIDTTGSVVHLSHQLCKKIKKNSLVIYLKATNQMREGMFKRYIKDPKPVVFKNIFSPRKGETDRQALRRCYPKLLTKRSKLYTKYADVIIPYKLADKKMGPKNFISLIRERL